jgi:hypothetical protein
MKDTDAPLGRRTIRIAGAPETIDAGDEFSVRIEVVTDTSTDISAEKVELFDASGNLAFRGPLSLEKDDPGSYSTAEFRLTAPGTTGPHVWTARLAPPGDDSTAEASFEVTVTAHRIAPVVWGIPPAIGPGEKFRVKIGARCPMDCNSADWIVTVNDDAGQTLAKARTGDTPWKGTEGLRHAEVELTAPDAIGVFKFEAVVSATNADLPHDTGTRRFSIRTAPQADAEIGLHVTDAETGLPAEGLKVAAHGFVSRTDHEGNASLTVPTGEQRIFVSGKGYFPYSETHRVDGQTDIEVAVTPDPGITEADVWA